MEKQSTLMELEDRIKAIKPEIRVIRNIYSCAIGLIKEEIIKKTWIIPSSRLN